MDVADQKTSQGHQLSVILTAADLETLEGGVPLRMTDPETKFIFEVLRSAPQEYVIETGESAYQVCLHAFEGRLQILDGSSFKHVFPREAGSITFRRILDGAKGTSGNDFGLWTVEFVNAS